MKKEGKKSVFLNKEKIKKSKTASDPQYTWGMFLYHFGICLVRHEAGKNSQLRDIFVLMYYTVLLSKIMLLRGAPTLRYTLEEL